MKAKDKPKKLKQIADEIVQATTKIHNHIQRMETNTKTITGEFNTRLNKLTTIVTDLAQSSKKNNITVNAKLASICAQVLGIKRQLEDGVRFKNAMHPSRNMKKPRTNKQDELA